MDQAQQSTERERLLCLGCCSVLAPRSLLLGLGTPQPNPRLLVQNLVQAVRPADKNPVLACDRLQHSHGLITGQAWHASLFPRRTDVWAQHRQSVARLPLAVCIEWHPYGPPKHNPAKLQSFLCLLCCLWSPKRIYQPLPPILPHEHRLNSRDGFGGDGHASCLDLTMTAMSPLLQLLRYLY